MNKTAIVTDSNSGITQAQGKELGIFVVPMPFLINGEQYYEDINLTQEQFYEKLKSDADVSTSQPIVGELLAFWDKILEEYDDMVYIPMSSGLSESCSTAKVLAQDYNGRIHVVDNQRISITQKQSVFDAKAMLKAGMSAEEIKNFLESTRLDASIYISLPTLKYLKKGGRITPCSRGHGQSSAPAPRPADPGRTAGQIPHEYRHDEIGQSGHDRGAEKRPVDALFRTGGKRGTRRGRGAHREL